ncbi:MULTISPECIES: hypothetical protein [unclassified Streptomyces]|uniref:hypothetical protein n=1 Tax=unclassified Streptomyces TaxID=2593676 RepID=UPI001AD818A9|nr:MULTISPECIES: hypothetical protein [unclassified Streptomyces]
MVEIAELVLKYVQALVWPGVTVGCVWVLRHQLTEALKRMSRVETPAGSIEFAAAARDVLDEAEELTGVPSESAEPASGDARHGHEGESASIVNPRRFREARHMADASPIGAIVSAWNELERVSWALIGRHPELMPEPVHRGMTPRWLDWRNMFQALGVSPDGLSLYGRLRDLRNRAVHGRLSDDVGPAAARDFVESCLLLARELEQLAP